jgi:hypothetical protein
MHWIEPVSFTLHYNRQCFVSLVGIRDENSLPSVVLVTVSNGNQCLSPRARQIRPATADTRQQLGIRHKSPDKNAYPDESIFPGDLGLKPIGPVELLNHLVRPKRSVIRWPIGLLSGGCHSLQSPVELVVQGIIPGCSSARPDSRLKSRHSLRRIRGQRAA